MIAIIDYGMGNIGSIENMLKKVGGKNKIVSNIADLTQLEKIILPGVGKFDNGIQNLDRLNFIEKLKDLVIEKKIPILGICLGMQLLTKCSQEGNLKGLGFIDAETIKFRFDDKKLKIPHMGWNIVYVKKDNKLVKSLQSEFYFVHSYYVICNNVDDILTTTKYGDIEFVSSFQKENIFGTQFHPEKSHKYGLDLMKNFVEF